MKQLLFLCMLFFCQHSFTCCWWQKKKKIVPASVRVAQLAQDMKTLKKQNDVLQKMFGWSTKTQPVEANKK